MMNTKKIITLFLFVLAYNSLTGQTTALEDIPKTERNLVLSYQDEKYDLKLYKFEKNGMKDMSLSKGPTLLKMGGNISKLLVQLNPDKFINTRAFRSKEVYFIALNTSQMTVVNDIGLKVSRQIMQKLGYNLNEEKVLGEVWEITIIDKSMVTTLSGVDVPAGVISRLSMDKENLNIIGDTKYLGLVLAKHYLSDYVFAEEFEGVFSFSIPKSLSNEKLNDFLEQNYGLTLKKVTKELEYLVIRK